MKKRIILTGLVILALVSLLTPAILSADTKPGTQPPGSTGYFSLPKLNYGFGDLAPFLSEEQVKIHYIKHHNAYVTAGNALLERMENARKENTEFDVKATLKELSWNLGGNVFHTLFWENLAPASKTTPMPTGMAAQMINREYGSFERFKAEFTKAALSVEGSGWAALTYSKSLNSPLIMQVEKHNNDLYFGCEPLLVLDMFEHAYYIDYKNDKTSYAANFWNNINWEVVNQRLEQALAK